MSKPRILVARAIFPDIVDRLRQHFDVQDNPDDAIWTSAELAERLADKDGAFTTGSQRIDAALLAAAPQLKIVANMAVGYNNFDVDAMTAAGVQGTNTPDVLTETTADFGFALLMATARRMTESEHYLRAGKWTKWSYDMFAGSDIHGSTLGIIGMGRIGQGIARRGAAASSAASTRWLPVVSTPSLSARRSASSCCVQITSSGLASTSKCSRRRSTMSGKIARATRMRGLLIFNLPVTGTR